MPKVKFLPSDKTVEVSSGTKLLVAAIRNKVPIRYGCAACQCGTCAVKIGGEDFILSVLEEDEKKLLAKMSLSLDGSVRLSCRARLESGEVTVDLDFQETYSPDNE